MTAQPAVADHLYPGNVVRIAIANSNGTLNAAIDNPIITWTIDQNAHAVTITAGQTLGRGTLTITDSTNQSVQIPVRVGLDAGQLLANSVSVQYTGSPIDRTWLQNVVQKMVLRNVQSQFTPQTVFNLPAILPPGSITGLSAQVQIPGNDQYYAVNASVNVNLQNVAAQPFTPPTLFYDDDPERITQDGVLYRGQVTAASPVRLYYYHENTDQPHQLVVAFTAASPATVHVIDASAGPNIDVMTVGHAVTRAFLTQKPNNNGLILNIPAGTPYVVENYSLDSLQGAAGSMGIHVLSGGPLTVTVASVPQKSPDSALPQLLNGPQLPGDGHHRTGVFNIANYGQDALTYRVGGDDASINYGLQSPPVVSPPDGHDYGEYGIWRTIDFTLQNPTAQPATAYLYEEPMGGPVRSAFVLNGQLPPVSIGCARVSQHYQIGPPLTIAPGLSHVIVQTMTDGGSNYPLEVGVTATRPQPQTPPITAPDGCFPKAQPAASPSPMPLAEPTGR